METKKGLRYFFIIGALIASIASLISILNKKIDDINLLKKQNPAFAVIYDSLGVVRDYLDEARYYAREENYEDALTWLDKAQTIISKEKIKDNILNALVAQGRISTKDREAVKLLQKQVEGLRGEIYQALARKIK